MQKLKGYVDRFEEGAIAFLLAAMAIVTFSQVVARYVFNAGAVWALELTVYLFAWLVLFGMSYGVKVGCHLGVDAFVRILSKPMQRVMVLVAVGACMAYALILLFGAVEYWTKIYRIGITAEDLPIPRWVPYSILPLGLVLLFVRFAQAAWMIVTGQREALVAGHEADELVEESLEVEQVSHHFKDDRPGRPGRGPDDG